MSAHRGYAFSSVRNVKALRKYGLIDHDKKKASPAVLFDQLSHIYKTDPRIMETLDCMIHAEEHYWMNYGQQVYFFEDADFCRNVMRGSYAIKETLPLYHGNESFILMLPDDFTFCGQKGSGLLVTVFNHAQRTNELFTSFFESMKLPVPNVTTSGEQGEYTVCISYQEKAGSYMYMRVAMPNVWLADICQMETLEQYSQLMKDRNSFHFFHGMGLDVPEMEYQFEVLRFVMGFMVYRHAMPQRIRDGLPSGISKHEFTTPHFQKPHTRIVSHPAKEKGEVQGHYRSWHFRQLTDDKYYKGEHEGKAKGSRIVFVSDSFVTKNEVHVSTVEAK